MTKINIDCNKYIGIIKPMHGVGQPPLLGISTEYFKYLKEANIPYSRLHDVGGWHGGNMFVDIPNIFRDFDADETNPDNYDFTFTDILIAGLIENGCEPVYRLGVTIENFHIYRAYRIFPPKDMEKWARICEHIIRHYNEGWANGFNYNIQYWEIWNEPDNDKDPERNAMWRGSKEDYFDLYRITSKHLKACFGDSIKVGGYASCGFYAVHTDQMLNEKAFGNIEPVPIEELQRRCYYYMEFFEDFIEMVQKENLPLDFFTYHSYGNVPETVKMQEYAEKKLSEIGRADTEIHINEWNTHFHMFDRGTSAASAGAAAMMCAMQNMKMSVMCYYDARIDPGVFSGLFNPLTLGKFCTYYSFKAFGNLYVLGNQTLCESDNPDVYAISATDGKKKAILISNIGENTEIVTNLSEDMKVYIIDQNNHMLEKELSPVCFSLNKNQVAYIESEI